MSGSHYTYIPIFPEDDEDNPRQWQKEAQELAKTMRLCIKCNTFQKFLLTKREPFWFYFSCPICNETIKLPRKRNRIAKSKTKKKWQ